MTSIRGTTPFTPPALPEYNEAAETTPSKPVMERSPDAPMVAPKPLRTRHHFPGLQLPPAIAGSVRLSRGTDALQEQAVSATRQRSAPSNARSEGAERFPSLGEARLKSLQLFDSVANEDKINPSHANQVYARIVKAHRLLRGLFNESPDLKSDIKYWDALMFAGEINNRLKRHAGLPGVNVDVTFLASSKELSGGIRRLGKDVHDGFEMTFTPKSRTEYFWTTAAHEALHASQYNRGQDALKEENLQTYRDNKPLVDFTGHPREKMLQLASNLPKKMSGTSTDSRSQSSMEIYTALPWELQALLEDAEALRLIEDDVHSQASPEQSFQLNSGLEKLGPLFTQAAKKLGGDSTDKVIANLFYRNQAFIFPKESGKALDYIENILCEVEALHTAMQSRGWDDKHTDLLSESMNKLSKDLSGRGKHFSAETHLHFISASLQSINDLLMKSDNAVDLRLPKVLPAQGQFEAGKAHPLAMLTDVLQAQFSNDLRAHPLASLDHKGISEMLFNAKKQSLFADKALSLQNRLINGETVLGIEDELKDVVSALATTLAGVHHLPMPAMHIFEAPSTFDHHEGLNLSGDQKRKIEFNPLTWQFHIPVHTLMEPDRLEARLSQMSKRLAWASIAIMIQPMYASKDLTTTHQYLRKERSAGAVNTLARDFLNPVKKELLGLAAGSKKYVKQNPTSAAALMHYAVLATPNLTEHLAWHRGLRETTKRNMAHGADAGRVYAALAHERNQLLTVAIERAIKVDSIVMQGQQAHTQEEQAQSV